MKRQIIANKSNLGSLLYHKLTLSLGTEEVEIEEIPEQYRMQKDLSIIIPYEEFMLYVTERELPDYVPGKEFSTIRRLINNKSPEVWRHYMDYLAIAQFKEIHFAYKYNARFPTKILPRAFNTNIISIPEALKGFNSKSQVTDQIMKVLNSRGFNLHYPLNSSEDIKTAFNLAAFYRWQSCYYRNKLPKRFSISDV